MEKDSLEYQIIGAAMEVHRILGPGFLESIYQQALLKELTIRNLTVDTEISVDILYKDTVIGRHRLDLLVSGIILELKCVSRIADVHIAQALSYLKATQLDLALILNFGESGLSWRRVVKRRLP